MYYITFFLYRTPPSTTKDQYFSLSLSLSSKDLESSDSTKKHHAEGPDGAERRGTARRGRGGAAGGAGAGATAVSRGGGGLGGRGVGALDGRLDGQDVLGRRRGGGAAGGARGRGEGGAGGGACRGACATAGGDRSAELGRGGEDLAYFLG